MDDKIKEYMREIGARGGSSKSEAKLRAIAENAKLAGRPRIPDEQLTDAQRKRRIRYENSKLRK